MRLYAAGTVALLGGSVVMALVHAPADPALGVAGRALYIHLPFAVNAYVWCVVAFVAAAGHLATRDLCWDRWGTVAVAGAAGASTIVLLTGMVLARGAWGQWWAWTPKLTFSLALWALLMAYVAVRLCIAGPARRAMVAAVYALVALLDAPLVYLSVKLLPDAHPAAVVLDAGARATLLLCVVSITMASAGLVVCIARGHAATPRNNASPERGPPRGHASGEGATSP